MTGSRKLDTIYALASAKGKAGVAIVRVSGPQAIDVVQNLCGFEPQYRTTSLRKIKTKSGNVIDTALILAFEEDHSFTGEYVAEFHLHGGVAVVNSVLREIGNMTGLRMAEPGEFTRRALENGCLDITQVEGLADLIDSETEAQRHQAMRVLSGELGKRADSWRKKLVRATALIEAGIDFSEEDLPDNLQDEAIRLVRSVLDDLEKEIKGAEISERIRDGFEVAIVGPPNVGKSTLLNTLARRKAALTSDIAGTTRDIIEVRMDVRGLAITLLDTAGIRDDIDGVEALGVERAKERASHADMRVFLVDEDSEVSGIKRQKHDIMILPKGDLRPDIKGTVSGKTGKGVPELLERIADYFESCSSGAAIINRERQREAIVAAANNLKSALAELLCDEFREELIANDLLAGLRALDVLIGRVDVEMFLDDIFSSFCIGK